MPLMPRDALHNAISKPTTTPKLSAPPEALTSDCSSEEIKCCASPGSKPDMAFISVSIVCGSATSP